MYSYMPKMEGEGRGGSLPGMEKAKTRAAFSSSSSSGIYHPRGPAAAGNATYRELGSEKSLLWKQWVKRDAIPPFEQPALVDRPSSAHVAATPSVTCSCRETNSTKKWESNLSRNPISTVRKEQYPAVLPRSRAFTTTRSLSNSHKFHRNATSGEWFNHSTSEQQSHQPQRGSTDSNIRSTVVYNPVNQTTSSFLSKVCLILMAVIILVQKSLPSLSLLQLELRLLFTDVC